MVPLIIIIVVITLSKNVSADCIFNITSFNSPLITDQNFKIAKHFGNIFTFEEQESFFVQCVSGTSSGVISENGDEATCEGGTNIRILRSDVVVDYQIIQCTPEPMPTVKKTNESCGTYGTKLNVGYEIHGNFSTVYTACFDEDYLQSLYVTFEQGDLGDFANEPEPSKLFHSGDLFEGIDIYDVFRDQKSTFEKLHLSQYITNRTNLVPGTLVPHWVTPFLFQKYATMDYVNVIPVWNSVYLDYLYFMSMYGSVLNSVGTYGVATLEDERGNSVELYLSDRQIPVPRWIWLRDGTTTSGYNMELFYNGVFDMFDDIEEEIQSLCEDY